ncbi:MAG: hypothetical protein IPN76_31835, partial [Saprospiraceae bacterium]|nr:hypothetical protein [Saprospiraceae bacterium]
LDTGTARRHGPEIPTQKRYDVVIVDPNWRAYEPTVPTPPRNSSHGDNSITWTDPTDYAPIHGGERTFP